MPTDTPTGLHPRSTLLLATGCAASVSTLYFNQPLLPEIARSFSATAAATGALVFLTQAGYAVGLLFIVPLTDLMAGARLTRILLLVTALLLTVAGLAPALGWLSVLSFLAGIATVVPQVIIPLVAARAPEDRRARTIAAMQTGMICGILLSRTVGGAIAEVGGWRATYFTVAAILCGLAFVVPRHLNGPGHLNAPGEPPAAPAGRLSYPRALASLPGLLAEPVLRRSALIGGAVFGAFMLFWSSLAYYVAEPPYNLGPAGAGVFGVLGLAGAVGALVAGRMLGRVGDRPVALTALLLGLAAFVVFALLGRSFWALVLGVNFLDLALQTTQIANQHRIFAIRPEARGRMNTIYMSTSFASAAIGSAIGLQAWTHGGWAGVCLCGGIILLLVLPIVLRLRGGAAAL